MTAQWLRQILDVMRLELRKTFFARRGLWVYLLAFAPLLLFLAHSIYMPRERDRLARINAEHPIPSYKLRLIQEGMTKEEVIAKVGEPYAKRMGQHRHGQDQLTEYGYFKYTDGKSDWTIRIFDGKVARTFEDKTATLDQETLIFATSFQFYFLRLAVFFGCAGIFMNLFRGEMLDKSLHFYLLTPIRREVLMIGKYLAGLIATTVIFTSSAALQMPTALWQFPRPEFQAYFAGPGWGHFAAYLGVTVLACVGYGSIFLAAGLLFRSPIIPAAVVLVWESATIFVPASLQQFSLIYYLQSLCPVVAPPDQELPIAVRMLLTSPQPATTAGAVIGIIIFTLAVLVIAGVRSRRLEINYATD
jgi:ABC-type transport system involved in multi-copper enzyme maturation permease subunit